MNTSLRNIALIWAVPIVLGVALATGLVWPRASDATDAGKDTGTGSGQKWTKVSVNMPVSQVSFPPGAGADIANSQCLICHSAGMVLRQPPLTQDEWTGEINKMRNSFGAPLPTDQVQALAKYLQSINGRKEAPGGPSAVDGQGS